MSSRFGNNKNDTQAGRFDDTPRQKTELRADLNEVWKELSNEEIEELLELAWEMVETRHEVEEELRQLHVEKVQALKDQRKTLRTNKS